MKYFFNEFNVAELQYRLKSQLNGLLLSNNIVKYRLDEKSLTVIIDVLPMDNDFSSVTYQIRNNGRIECSNMPDSLPKFRKMHYKNFDDVIRIINNHIDSVKNYELMM